MKNIITYEALNTIWNEINNGATYHLIMRDGGYLLIENAEDYGEEGVSVNCYDEAGELYDCSGFAVFDSLEEAIEPSGYSVCDIVRAYDDWNEFDEFENILRHIDYVATGYAEVEVDSTGIDITYGLDDGGEEVIRIEFTTADEFYHEAFQAYQDFDADDWADMHYGEPGAPGMRRLLEDADDISNFLYQLSVCRRYSMAA